MPSIYDFSELEILAFFLVLVRLSAFVVSWPVLGAASVPASIKVLFALTLSLMVFPIVDYSSLDLNLISSNIISLVIREAFIGLVFGYLAKMFFFAVRIAGDIASVSMSLSSSQLFNPALGGRVSSVEQFKLIVASLFFLAIDGHQLLVAGVLDSFRILPLSNSMLNLSHLIGIGSLVSEIMVIGVKMSAPVLISLLFMNLTMAVISRTVPQINVLITSLPVNILVGFIVLIASVPVLIWQMHGLMEISTDRLFYFVKNF